MNVQGQSLRPAAPFRGHVQRPWRPWPVIVRDVDADATGTTARVAPPALFGLTLRGHVVCAERWGDCLLQAFRPVT